MPKYIKLPALIVDIALTGLLIFLMVENVMKPGPMFLGALSFFIINLILLTLLFEALGRFIKVLRLKGLKVNSYAYYLYPVALTLSFVTINLILFRIGRYNAPQGIMVVLIGLSILLVLISQVGGAFPDVRRSERKLALRHEKAGGNAGGFELLGSLSGKYDDGIVIGTQIIPNNTLNSMHRSGDAVILEGNKGDIKQEIIVVSDKSQKFFIDLLAERLHMPEKEIKTGLNIKNRSKKNEYYLHNRQERRRQERARKRDDNKDTSKSK